MTYTYDDGGNLRTKSVHAYTLGEVGPAQKTVVYTYGNENWKDQLTAYDGKPITYDAIGNPLSYDGWTYTWAQGRQLQSLSKGTDTLSFAYNAAGQRIEKTVNGVTTRYILSGTQVAYEIQGNDTLHYSRDGQGGLFALTWNEETYFYVHNLQGDVIGLLDRTGALVVRYTYDTWGKPLTVEGTLAETLGQKNPYRYRGYSYDGETGLYYVGARYYDPVITRWLSPEPNVYEGGFDEGAGLLAPNVYAYCANNPVILYDPSGEALMLALEGEGYLVTTAAAGGANFWNPVGWVLLGVAVIGVGYTIYQNQKYKPKAPSLPSYNKLRLNKNHIMSGHSAGGNRGGPNKDRFPKWMTWSMIQKAIQEAYNTGKRVQTQGDSVFLRGFSKTYNTVVEMWVNLKDKIIETAWPK